MPLFVVLLLVLGAGYLLFNRSQELFRIDVSGGKPVLTRGQLPLALLNDFRAVLRGVARGRITAHKGPGGARLSFDGQIDEGVAQRLRNIFGLHPVARWHGPRVAAERRR